MTEYVEVDRDLLARCGQPDCRRAGGKDHSPG